MLLRYTAAAGFASAGAALGVLNVWNGSIATNNGEFVWNDLTFFVAGLALVAAMLSLSIGWLWRQSKVVTVLCMVTIFACVFVSVGNSIKRFGGTADRGAGAAKSHNGRVTFARGEVFRLEPKIEQQLKITARECRGFREGVSKPQKWPLCSAARTLLANYRYDIAKAKAMVAKLGSRQVVDPVGERLEALFGAYMPAAFYRNAHPVLAASGMELGTTLLLTIAGMLAASGSPAPRRRDNGPIDVEFVEVRPLAERNRMALEQVLGVHGIKSNRELAGLLGWSESKTSREVTKLREAGLIDRQQDGKSKAIKLLT